MENSSRTMHYTVNKSMLIFFVLCINIVGCFRVPPDPDKVTMPGETVLFPAGPNVELVEGRCLYCHSANYVIYQPAQDRAGWQAVLTKMQSTFDMSPLNATEESAILDYLVSINGLAAP